MSMRRLVAGLLVTVLTLGIALAGAVVLGFAGALQFVEQGLQAVECGLPLVTRQGRFMRGRLASAILARMRLDELVAATDEHYVQLAVRLAQDEPLRQRIRGDLLARQAILFDDLEPIRALESFLLGRCRPSDAGGG